MTDAEAWPSGTAGYLRAQFENGEADGTCSSLDVIATAARACGFGRTSGPGDTRERCDPLG